MQARRVLSGMRPTGPLHLGHYHGVLENWLNLQHEYDCYFFVADWHALTTHYETPEHLAQFSKALIVEWLACGIDPDKATIFVQSHMPEHAELHVLLSMGTPLSWLERVPTYKDQQEKLKDRDLTTYGFLGYPLLQSADILLYQATHVPVGADQVAHVELTREVARRFNHLYGRERHMTERIEVLLSAMSADDRRRYRSAQRKYQEQGDEVALRYALEWLLQQPLAEDDKYLLKSGLDGSGKTILCEPQAMLTAASKMPGLDGLKMSKSYGNTIALRDSAGVVTQKIQKMPTDPARIRVTDPGNPEICPVYQLHEIYSDAPTKAWATQGCRTAEFGCLTCKKPVSEAIIRVLEPIQEQIHFYEQKPDVINDIVRQGTLKARQTAAQTLAGVRSAMGLFTL